ncbi:hypothetical protein ACROYT_G014281 [Oculina patagonica]
MANAKRASTCQHQRILVISGRVNSTQWDLFKGSRVVIPRVMRPEVKSRIHSSHLGVEACLRKARDTVFWPNMNAEVRDLIKQCSICNEFQAKNQKQPTQSHQIPDRPWSRVAADQFKIHGKEYIVLVDFYSDFIEVKQLQETTSSSVIEFLKYGIADTLVTDNSHVIGSLYTCHPPRTTDQRNIPTESLEASPAQRLMCRRTGTRLPTATSLFYPKVPESVTEKLKLKWQKAKWYHDRSTRILPELEVGQEVRVAPLQKNETWKRGTCLEKSSGRSYLVKPEGNGQVVRRNREFLKPAKKPLT